MSLNNLNFKSSPQLFLNSFTFFITPITLCSYHIYIDPCPTPHMGRPPLPHSLQSPPHLGHRQLLGGRASSSIQVPVLVQVSFSCPPRAWDRSTGFATSRPLAHIWLCFIVATCQWASPLISLSLDFLTCKVGEAVFVSHNAWKVLSMVPDTLSGPSEC